MELSNKKIIALAIAAIAEMSGKNIHNLRVISFKKIQKNTLKEYLEKNKMEYHKYQLGDENYE